MRTQRTKLRLASFPLYNGFLWEPPFLKSGSRPQESGHETWNIFINRYNIDKFSSEGDGWFMACSQSGGPLQRKYPCSQIIQLVWKAIQIILIGFWVFFCGIRMPITVYTWSVLPLQWPVFWRTNALRCVIPGKNSGTPDFCPLVCFHNGSGQLPTVHSETIFGTDSQCGRCLPGRYCCRLQYHLVCSSRNSVFPAVAGG